MQISSLSAPTVTVFNRLFQSKFRWNSSERRRQKYQTRSKTTDKSQQAQKVFVMQMSNDILWFFSKVKKLNCEILSCWLHSGQSFFRSNLQVFEVIVQVFLFMFTLTKDCSSHQKPECWLIGYIKPYDIHVSLTWRTIGKVHVQNSASIKYTMCSHTVRLLCLIKNAWSKVGWTSSRVAACATGPLPVWVDVLFWLLALRLQTSTKSKYQLFHHCCLMLKYSADESWWPESSLHWMMCPSLRAAHQVSTMTWSSGVVCFFHHQSQHQEFSSCFSDKQCWVQILTLAHIKNHIFQPH